MANSAGAKDLVSTLADHAIDMLLMPVTGADFQSDPTYMDMFTSTSLQEMIISSVRCEDGASDSFAKIYGMTEFSTRLGAHGALEAITDCAKKVQDCSASPVSQSQCDAGNAFMNLKQNIR